MKFRSLALIGTALLALTFVVAGCGGDSDSDTTGNAATTPATTAEAPPAKAGNDSGSMGKEGGGNSAEDNSAQSGEEGGSTTSSGSSTNSGSNYSGGDNSIQTYGHEASGDDKAEVVKAMRAYFTALSHNDILDACAYFTDTYKKTLEQGAARFLKSKGESAPGGCAGLAKMLPKLTGSMAAESRPIAKAKITKVRIDGDNAFVLYTPSSGTSKGKPSYFPMQREDGSWKTNTLLGTAFP